LPLLGHHKEYDAMRVKYLRERARYVEKRIESLGSSWGSRIKLVRESIVKTGIESGIFVFAESQKWLMVRPPRTLFVGDFQPSQQISSRMIHNADMNYNSIHEVLKTISTLSDKFDGPGGRRLFVSVCAVLHSVVCEFVCSGAARTRSGARKTGSSRSKFIMICPDFKDSEELRIVSDAVFACTSKADSYSWLSRLRDFLENMYTPRESPQAEKGGQRGDIAPLHATMNISDLSKIRFGEDLDPSGHVCGCPFSSEEFCEMLYSPGRIGFVDTGPVLQVLLNCFMTEMLVSATTMPYRSIAKFSWWQGTEGDYSSLASIVSSNASKFSSAEGPSIDSVVYRAACAVGYRRVFTGDHLATTSKRRGPSDGVQDAIVPHMPVGVNRLMSSVFFGYVKNMISMITFYKEDTATDSKTIKVNTYCMNVIVSGGRGSEKKCLVF
jgi:hypothetical protein